MPSELYWQLIVDGQPISGGTFLSIKACRLADDQVFIVLQNGQVASTTTFRVHSNINIGGKNHLLLANADSPGSSLIVVRLFDRTRVCAMDPDRFSSLRNALLSFVESGDSTTTTELFKLLAT